ncbi:MAG TPA: dephospho-CoA kinase [Cyclobacteriaceae bacterium]
MLQIGITGGIGSGKSLVCKIFQCLDVPVYDADSRARVVMNTDKVLIDQIRKEFGDSAYNTDGTLNRKHISEKAFGNPERLKTLDNLVHPRVGLDYSAWVSSQNSPYVIKEAALLYEAGSYKTLDKIIVVGADEELRIKRVMARDPHRTEQMIRDIIKNQIPQSEKVSRADFVVVNDESQLVIPQVIAIHQHLLSSPPKSY